LNQDLEENKEKRKNVSRELAKSEFLNKLWLTKCRQKRCGKTEEEIEGVRNEAGTS
jgi:hypothetical protein